MLSGRRLNILDPSPLDIEIRDIAHGLARVARWNGQTVGEHSFSVAQHSLLVDRIVGLIAPASPADHLAALLHDAPEYVIGDIISPFKSVIGEAYKTVEARIEHAIHLRFGIPYDPDGRCKRLIKSADTVAAYFEAVALAGFAPDEARRFFGNPQVSETDIAAYLAPWPTGKAQAAFLARFAEAEAAFAAAE
ncbi:YfbR-like 5'-deoxynucleotidase [Acuticoccus yangtzensis]|uniref:YfbR-like 5'-deoxynucleotidase n=1 Tax=Acuticoccus yangtzensis TaxID=1443441 RepID=UPI000949B032|nr:HD family hydrolase [Acuticoccus yangtzensis]ORE94662.1 hydrolase protein [Stappia sp. 22II-S9-Z10]